MEFRDILKLVSSGKGRVVADSSHFSMSEMKKIISAGGAATIKKIAK